MVLVCSPLVVDLDRDGKLTWPGKKVDFDLLNNGVTQAMTWIDPGDAWLARDIDGSGCIESGAELFGQSTRLADGTLAQDGFQALSEWNTNGDKQVGLEEARAAGITLWKDNGDAICQPSELHALEARDIVSLGLVAQRRDARDADDNRLLLWGEYTTATGQHFPLVDVFFRVTAP